MKVLFVCTGNTCRSPAAEKMFSAAFPSAETRSRGTEVYRNNHITPQVGNFLKKNGLDFSEHRAALVAEEDIDWADYIFVMEERQFSALADRYPQSCRKMYAIKDFCYGENGDVDDPIGRSDSFYERVMEELKACVAVIAEKLGKRH